MFKYKVGDEVIVTTGRDRGKKGKIDKVLAYKNSIIVGGINVYKRHKKATRNRAAGIYEIARPMLVNKVAIICPKCTKATKISFVFQGKVKNRICKKCKGIFKND